MKRQERDLRRMLIIATLDPLAGGLLIFGLPWVALTLGGSAAEAAALSVVSTVSYVGMSSVSGAIGDRFGHRRVLRISGGVQMAAATAAGVAMLYGVAAIPLMVMLSLTIGMGRAFAATSTYAATAKLVNTDRLPLAFAHLTIARHIGVFGGPALGAVIYGLGRIPALMTGVIVACFLEWLMAMAMANSYKFPLVKKGISWLRRVETVVGDRQMRVLLLAGFVWNLPAGAALGLAVPLMHDQMRLTSFGSSVVLGAGAVGSIAVSPLMRILGGHTDVTRLSVRGIAWQGATLMLLAEIVSLWFVIPVYALMMLSNTTVASNLHTARVQKVPPHQQTLVVGLGLFVSNLGYGVSGLIAVFLASISTLPVIFLLLGLSMLGCALVMHGLLLGSGTRTRPVPAIAAAEA